MFTIMIHAHKKVLFKTTVLRQYTQGSADSRLYFSV